MTKRSAVSINRTLISFSGGAGIRTRLCFDFSKKLGFKEKKANKNKKQQLNNLHSFYNDKLKG
jgi:hypothetical protein